MLSWLGITLLLCLQTVEGNVENTKRLQSLCEEAKHGLLRVRSVEHSDLQDLCQCTGIRSLALLKPRIVTVPECFSRWKSLKRLSLKKARLHTFPMALLGMDSLQELDISHTNISVLPEQLSTLEFLRSLVLRGTNITTLPSGLPRLERVDMRSIQMTRDEQRSIRKQYPNTKIYFSSPCKCG